MQNQSANLVVSICHLRPALQANSHSLTSHGQSLGFPQPSCCPTGPLISQQNSSSFVRPPGLGNSISGSDCSPPREESPHIIFLSPGSAPMGTDPGLTPCLPFLPDSAGIFLSPLVVQEFFCYLQLVFPVRILPHVDVFLVCLWGKVSSTSSYFSPS